ncbi:polymer-forming cytoskeletal protein [Candidatus Uhrbacteria bacterium]|nr:polymer-forming cytoskeletal protein [Candidatus Uhrbacteria bacterium]
MFKKSEGGGQGGETIIAPGVRVEGDFTSQGFVLIDGEVIGSVKTEADLDIGERANISADVAASNAHVAGTIKGNIRVGERLEIAGTAHVSGDVVAKVLVVEQGAIINGKISMGEGAAE